MPPHLPPLTLIVATTPTLGIGLRGSLPWPPLKPDLAFFARVTKRVPPLPVPTQNGSNTHATENRHREGTKRMNAVVMGRKTWESIPKRFRPLGGRVNVVVSRKAGELGLDGEGKGIVKGVGGLEEGLRWLGAHAQASSQQQQQSSAPSPSPPPSQPPKHPPSPHDFALARTFIIGGAQLYAAALALPNCERVLWTRVEREYECDTWFPRRVLPLDVEKEGEDVEGKGEDIDDKKDGTGGRWVRRSREEMEGWVGEEGVAGRREEGGLGFEVLMVERVG